MKINDFGLLLTTVAINKAKILSTTDNYRKSQMKKQEEKQKKQEIYFNNYERKRDEDEVLYNEYLQKRQLIANKWNITKNELDLRRLVSLEKPQLSFPAAIYTIDIKKSNLK